MTPTETTERIVRQEVLVCLSAIVADYQESHPDEWFEDCTNLSREVCPHCEEVHDEEEADLDGENNEHNGETWNYRCPSCGAFYDDSEHHDAEVYEWWAVTDWLADKLEARGEVILTMPGDVKVWGRQATGQAISMDGVISRIGEAIS